MSSAPTPTALPVPAFNAFTDYQNRAGYMAANGGQQPGDWNGSPSGPCGGAKKTWADMSQAGKTGTVTYPFIKQLDGSANGPLAEVDTFTISCEEACSFNFPGLSETYAPYVIAPTNAQSGPALVNPEILSTFEQAAALATALGLPNSAVIAGPGLTWNGETRQDWMIEIPGNPAPYYAGSLIKIQNANGVGYPGAWSIQSLNGNPPGAVWTPTPTPPDGITTGIPTVTVPVPCLPPPPGGYQFVPGAVPGSILVSLATPVAPGGGGGGLTETQAQQLTSAQLNAAAVAQRLGLTPE